MEFTGFKRWIAVYLIALSIVWICVSYATYGLKAQASLQLSLIIPLLFAGLLLGRVAVWLGLAGLLAALMLGLHSDIVFGAASNLEEGLIDLVQPGLACLIVALILDRLIAELNQADQRAQELDLVCDQLEVEIEEKERSQAQLIHSQKMEAIGHLAGGAAHDFNNLLSVIVGYATDPMNIVDFNQATRNLDGIGQVAQRGGTVTRRLLSLTRNTVHKSMFDLVKVVDDLQPLVSALFSSRVRLFWELPRFPVFVEMDRDAFELALLNIASNARDSMPGGGSFSIRVIAYPSEVDILFTDTGCGMEPEVADRIFEPFFTTKPEGVGTGIGLAVVYQTITEVGGHLQVSSQVDKGTTIILRLPRRPDHTAAD